MKKGFVVLTGVIGFIGGAVLVGRITSKSSNEWKKMSDKFFSNTMVFNQWMMAKQSGKNIADYLKKNNYKKIIIYGMSYIGERLVDELNNTEIEIVAGVDRNAKGIFANMPMLLPDEDMPEADCMIVTPVFFFDEIKEKMAQRFSNPIISFEDIFYDL